MRFPVKLEADDNGSLLVTFPDVPEANSVGDDEAEALINALDALKSALEIYFDERRPIPEPSKAKRGQPVVQLPALESAKVLLWNEMHRQHLRKADLARKLNVHMPQVDRLFDLKHSSKFEFVEQAAQALGKTLCISLRDEGVSVQAHKRKPEPAKPASSPAFPKSGGSAAFLARLEAKKKGEKRK